MNLVPAQATKATQKFRAVLAAMLFATTLAAQVDEKPKIPATLPRNAPCGSCDEPKQLSWQTLIPSDKADSAPLVIRGRIFQSDGKTPAEGMVLFVYHTDQADSHSRADHSFPFWLKGWMKVGADGRFEFRTVRLSLQAFQTAPTEIRAHIYGPGYSERAIDPFWFKDDPRVDEKQLKYAASYGAHPAIVDIKRGSDGVWRGERDITLPAAK